jgi:hypothetical protein
MPKRTDLETKRIKRDLLNGLRGRDRKAQIWWMDALERAGLPVWLRFGRAIGPYDITELRERLAGDPELLEVFEEAHRASRAEVAARCAAAGWQI